MSSYTKDFLVHKIQYLCGTEKYDSKKLWRMTNDDLEDLLEEEILKFWEEM